MAGAATGTAGTLRACSCTGRWYAFDAAGAVKRRWKRKKSAFRIACNFFDFVLF